MAVSKAPMSVMTSTIRPGHQEVVAVVGLVEPEPVCDDHRPAGTLLPLGGPACRPLADRPLGVALDDPGRVGVGPVDEELHLGVAEASCRAKSGRMRTIPSTLRSSISCSRLRHRGQQSRVEVGRELKPAASSVASGEGSSRTTATGTFFTSSDRP